MSTLLLIDAGNSRIKVDQFEAGEMRRVFSVDSNDYADTVPAKLDAVTAPGAAMLASVVRGVDAFFGAELKRRWEVDLVVVDAGMPIGIEVDVPRPDSVGIDRLLGAGEAFRRTEGATVVVGVGTAITVDVVTDSGVFVGGSISAGMRTTAWALSERTSLLPEVDIEEGERGVPKSTQESLLTGVLVGTGGAVDRLVEELTERAGLSAFSVVLTGGDSGRLSPYLEAQHIVEDDLVTWGLAHTYERLMKSA